MSIGIGEIENLYVLHAQFDFPHRIVLENGLQAVCVDSVLLQETITILKQLKEEKKKLCVEYDTTFNLTDFYVSILTFVHPFLLNRFDKSPPIPLFYYFHTKKFTETHEDFWRQVEKKLSKWIEHIFIIILNKRMT